MNVEKNETAESIRGRLSILAKCLVSERNSVAYYETLLEKTPEDSEENIGIKRMYEDLREEETHHVAKIESWIQHWESELKNLEK
ncbi:MAG: hypothetical protein COV66_13620 [Nitrospinae bacterium CG11_big_fil_rev_8_21_14_0_20_45_15]|nr:MAG: hypothetical protein COV66_13620 [Nitrospinae bacterium CG11_big_fil_rev_8_21_14_0_20_45_15]